MIEQDYDDFLELMSRQQSWIACELGENLSEVLLEEMQSE